MGSVWYHTLNITWMWKSHHFLGETMGFSTSKRLRWRLQALKIIHHSPPFLSIFFGTKKIEISEKLQLITISLGFTSILPFYLLGDWYFHLVGGLEHGFYFSIYWE